MKPMHSPLRHATTRKASPIIALLIMVMLPRVVPAQNATAEWFKDEMQQLTTARDIWWIADNAPYRRSEEPFTHYAIRWTASDGGHTLTGELVAMDSVGRRTPMWSYRMFWHPGENKAYLMQTSSWGAYAVGPMGVDSTGSGRTILNEQDIWQPDGSKVRTRHRSWFDDQDTHITESFNWQDGEWIPTRSYRWIRRRLD